MKEFKQKGFKKFNLDEITDPIIIKAMEAVSEKVDKAEKDLGRPTFHYRPPAQWMNDPNGTIYHKGYYHVFYQHNPYDEIWGNMHWGHARSKDMVNWEQLPIALGPSLEKKEEHIFSGCAWLNGEGKPVILYSSVGEYPCEQWAAHPVDEECFIWEKCMGNPIVTTKVNDQLTFNPHMQDPFIFETQGRTFMVLCAGIDEERYITIHEALEDTLLKWEYRGIAYKVEDNSGGFNGYAECPNLFPLDGKFVLLHLGPVMYRVGDFDINNYSFSPDLSARLDIGNAFHATNIMEDEKGKILISWIQSFGEWHDSEKPKKGWSGVLALPRRMKIDEQNRLIQSPIIELQVLRDKSYEASNITLEENQSVVIETNRNTLEIIAEFDRDINAKAGILLKCGAGEKSDFVIAFDGEKFDIGGNIQDARFITGSKNVKIHAFVDRSVIEIFINDGLECATYTFLPFLSSIHVEAFTQNSSSKLNSLKVWELNSVW